MITYLRNRLSERSTWVGLAVFLACIVLAWVCREQIYTALVGIAALIRAGLSDGKFRTFVAKFRRTLSTPPADPVPVQLPRSIPMSSNFVAELEAAALNGVKSAATALPAPIGPAVSAVLAAIENDTSANVIAAVVAVATAVEAALATVPSGYVAAPAPQEPVTGA